LSLEHQPPQQFDLLVLDAFSGDAIPVHLLTVEAFKIYLNHMAPQGVIAVHISNRHFDLQPVVQAIADHHSLATAFIHCENTQFGGYSSYWILVAKDPKALDSKAIRDASTAEADNRRVLWTDDHASLVEVLGRPSIESLDSKIRTWLSELREEFFGAKGNEASD
jgi:spermidine synthase